MGSDTTMSYTNNSGATGRDGMHAESKQKEPSATGGRLGQTGKRRLPDPPDPDNLPIDYPGSGWDSGRYPSAVPGSLRPQHSAHRRSA
ncbi:UNVERIFIED_CONTAM: hypothetical protein ABIE34_003167 [Jeotgalibacillus campisalis]